MGLSRLPAGGLGSAPARLPGLQKVWDQGYQGQGVGIAIIDTGIEPIADLEDRVIGWYDSEGRWDAPKDPSGHGTISAGCAAGNGRYKGVAPKANLIGVAVGSAPQSLERALEWVINNREQHNIKVINMSLGMPANDSLNKIAELCRKAVKSGLFVCASMGNSHGFLPPLVPAILPEVFGVGAYDDKNTAELSDDDVAAFSNRGDADTLPNKPDILTPGKDVMVPVPVESEIGKAFGTEDGYIRSMGTSEASPYAAGMAAILFQAAPDLSPSALGDILRKTASPHLPRERWEQGAGLIQADRALEAALSDRA